MYLRAHDGLHRDKTGFEPAEARRGFEPAEAKGGFEPAEAKGGSEPAEAKGGFEPAEAKGGFEPAEAKARGSESAAARRVRIWLLRPPEVYPAHVGYRNAILDVVRVDHVWAAAANPAARDTCPTHVLVAPKVS